MWLSVLWSEECQIEKDGAPGEDVCVVCSENREKKNFTSNWSTLNSLCIFHLALASR